MARLLSATAIAAQALREIGAYSPYDSAPDPVELEISLERLELAVAEEVGSQNLWFFQPAAQSFALTAGTASYLMAGRLATTLQFFNEARLVDANGNESPVELIRREAYEDLEPKDQAGMPDMAWVERKDQPTLYIWPVIATTGYSLRLVGQAYSSDLLLVGGAVPHGFPAAWQRFLVLALAADIGAGPVRALPVQERTEKERKANEARTRLKRFNAREQIDRPRFTRVWNPTDV